MYINRAYSGLFGGAGSGVDLDTSLRNSSIQTIPTLGPKLCKQYLLGAICIPRDLFLHGFRQVAFQLPLHTTACNHKESSCDPGWVNLDK